jgi:hypothetical protein
VLFEDYNFWLRVFALFKVKYCAYPCLIYRIKQQSAVYNSWTQNNKERYYYDRVLSNFQALSYTNNEKVRTHLQQKISQYLKALSAADSACFTQLFKYLLKHGYYKLPYKTLVKKKAGKLLTG